MSTNPLIQIAEEHSDKIYALFEISTGRLNFELKNGEKADFLEIKVLNEEAKLAGIVWFFGHRRAYIQDIRNLVERKKKQQIKFFLVAGEGTTSAGKKELKSHDISIVKSLSDVKVSGGKKKRKRKLATVKKEEVSIEDDAIFKDSTPLVELAKTILQKNEPEIIKAEKTSYANYETLDLKGFTSSNDLIAIVRTIEMSSIGVGQIRDYANAYANSDDTINMTLICNDKFTPSAKKEGQALNFHLISLKSYTMAANIEQDNELIDRLLWGIGDMLSHVGYEKKERKDKEFIRIETGSDNLGTYLYSENKEGENILALIPLEEVVRVATIREFADQMRTLNVQEGWIIAIKRFTYTADREAENENIRLLKKNHPIFNIFEHDLVPEHQLMTKKEIKDILNEFNAKITQLPRIYEDDHGVVAINAKPGDVVRILRTPDSKAYRYVIPRPKSATSI